MVRLSSLDLRFGTFQLPRRERFVTGMFRKTHSDLSGDVPLAGVHGTDDRQKLIFWRALQNLSDSARAKGSLNLGVPVRVVKTMMRASGNSPRNGDQGVGAVGSGQPKIHECHVGPVQAELLPMRIGFSGFIAYGVIKAPMPMLDSLSGSPPTLVKYQADSRFNMI
jgi:hypothetical protein